MSILLFESNYSILGDIAVVIFSMALTVASFPSIKYVKKNTYIERVNIKPLILIFVYVVISISIVVFFSFFISLVSKLI